MKKLKTGIVVGLMVALTAFQVFSQENKASESIYQLSSDWNDSSGKKVQLKEFSGYPVLITMGYTSCAHSCPLILNKIKEIEKAIAAKKIKVTYKIVFVSFDTVRDRPKDLKKYLKKKELDETVWAMLSSENESSVRELANVLGVNYKDVGDGDFVHSNVISLLDKKGNILAKVENLTADIGKLVESLGEQGGK